MKVSIQFFLLSLSLFFGFVLSSDCSDEAVSCIQFESNKEVEYCDNCWWKWLKDQKTGNCVGHVGACSATLISFAVIFFVIYLACIIIVCVRFQRREKKVEGFTRYAEDDPFHK